MTCWGHNGIGKKNRHHAGYKSKVTRGVPNDSADCFTKYLR